MMIEPGYVTLYPTIRNVKMSSSYGHCTSYRIVLYRIVSYHIISYHMNVCINEQASRMNVITMNMEGGSNKHISKD